MRSCRLLWRVLIIVTVPALIGCIRDKSGVSDQDSIEPATTFSSNALASSATAQTNAHSGWSFEKSWEESKRESEERRRNPILYLERHPSKWFFPNFEVHAGVLKPIGRNDYSMDDRYPSYLLCDHDVEEATFDYQNDARYFEDALAQIRRYGAERFPKIRWIAVVIFNFAEHKGISFFEQSFKVGAIFDAKEVFDPRSNLSNLVNNASRDLRPIKYDPNDDIGQHWSIVERHANAVK